jgi:hypothetical protein
MVKRMVTRCVIVDTRSAMHDGMNTELCLFDKVVVSGLPGIRYALEGIDNPDPLDYRPRHRPEIILRLLLDRLNREGSAPLDEERVRAFFQDCEYLQAQGAMVEPTVTNIWWEAALNFDEDRLRNSLSIHRDAAAYSEVFTARSNIDYTAVPDEFGKVDVLQYVLRQVPIPRANVPLQELLSFRADRGNQASLSRLRRWMTEQSGKTKGPAELEDSFLSAYDDYKKAIALLDKKYLTTSLGLVVSVGAEVVDNLLRMKWGSAAKAVFSWRKASLERQAEEAKAPGKELAYLAALERAFPSIRSEEGDQATH